MKLDDKPMRIGDKIIERGRVFRIFEIKSSSNGTSNGYNNGRMIYYRPFFKTAENRTLICCFPVDCLDQINVRRPVNVVTLRELLRELSRLPAELEPIDINAAKDVLGLNDPRESVRLLRYLWRDKVEDTVVFTKSKSEVFRRAKSRFAEEVAIVASIALDKADEKIDRALGRA